MSRLESVDNALGVLLILGSGRRVSVTEVAKEIGVAPSTAHRLLSTLLHRDFAEQGEDRSYAAGPALLQLRSQQSSRDRLMMVARPNLRTIVDTINETCHLAVLSDREVHFLLSEEAHHGLRIGSRAGHVMPAHLTAAGKIMLADLPPPQLTTLYSPKGVPELDLDADAVARFYRELAVARRRGIAVNRGATERGLHAVAVAVHGVGGRAVAALTVSVPSVRNTPSRMPEFIAALQLAGSRITATLDSGPA